MKKIILIAFLFLSFGSFAQTKIGATLVRNSPTDTYAVTFDSLQRGGMHVYSTLAERDAIPTGLRKIGMLAAVDTLIYQLKTGITNANWSVFKPDIVAAAYTLTKNATRDSIILSNGVVRNAVKDSAGGAIPTLQQVTDAGSTTTKTIQVSDGFNVINISPYSVSINQSGMAVNINPSDISFVNGGANTSLGSTGGSSNYLLPNKTAVTNTLAVTLNGAPADAAGNFTFVAGASTNIYNTNGKLTSSRRVNNNGYLLKFDSATIAIVDTTLIDGHLYDYNKGASFVDYNTTNVSSLIQNEISGVKFSTNDRNNLDTANNVWVKPDRVEINSTNRFDINSKTFYPSTYTTAGTTGNQTINKNSGSVNIAPAITTLTVTNNLVTANTIVSARVSSNDATAEILNVVSVSNGFIITMATPATAEAQIKFWITN